jgi:hypothetical protein
MHSLWLLSCEKDSPSRVQDFRRTYGDQVIIVDAEPGCDNMKKEGLFTSLVLKKLDLSRIRKLIGHARDGAVLVFTNAYVSVEAAIFALIEKATDIENLI